MPLTEAHNARHPWCLALDIGTSSTRAILFDAGARQVMGAESQKAWDLIETPDGGLVADADALLDLVVGTIDDVVGDSRAEIACVGISCFWHSLLGLDDEGRPVTPVYMWIDNRSSEDAWRLRDDAELALRMRTETGCRPHSSYWPAKLTWLQRTDHRLFDSVSTWVSFADYLGFVLTGELVTSIAMASGTGLLNVTSATWQTELAGRFGVASSRLAPLVDRDDPLPPLRRIWRSRWPALAGSTWYPALGDGAAANVGAGCVGSDRIAMTIGTSAAMRVILDSVSREDEPAALWHYRLDRTHHIFGGALSNGGNVSAWLAETTASGDIAVVADEAAEVSPDDHGLTWLPFFAGERSPSWDDRATASVVGMRFSTTRGDLFRGALEGTAYRLAAVYDDVRRLTSERHTIHANGGAALASPLWMQIIADTFDHDILATAAQAEISARGAAISALQSHGVLKSLRPDTIDAVATYRSDPVRHDIYMRARSRQTRLEAAIREASQA